MKLPNGYTSDQHMPEDTPNNQGTYCQSPKITNGKRLLVGCNLLLQAHYGRQTPQHDVRRQGLEPVDRRRTLTAVQCRLMEVYRDDFAVPNTWGRKCR